VHLLVCDNKWIFKMYGATIKRVMLFEPNYLINVRVSVRHLYGLEGALKNCWDTQMAPWISGPSPSTKTKFLSFNRTQSRVVIGLLTGHNTLKSIFTSWGWPTSPYIGGVEQRRKPQTIFCVSVKLWLHSDTHIWAHFSWTQRILSPSLVAVWAQRVCFKV
jgi:hypothetical protein